MNSSGLTLQNPSFLQPVQACGLEDLNRLDRWLYQHFQDLFMDPDNYQSDVTMEDPGSTMNSQVGLDGLNGLNAIPPFAFSHDRFFMPQPTFHRTSFSVVGPLSEDTGPFQGLLPHIPRSSANYGLTQPQHSMYSEAFSAFGDSCVMEWSSEGADLHSSQLFQDISLHGMSNSVYEPAAQPFQGFNYEEHVPLNSSARFNEQLSVPIMQASQAKDKVKCTWDGCSVSINKYNLAQSCQRGT
ncbi:hypothetical protein F4604DRAFT_1919062 [Suillus subluteus]|nr:hypothetical protein F4604DRAFT_1919062 [Suillus subluteus]